MTEQQISESAGCEFRRCVQYERETNEPPSTAAAAALARYHDEGVTATNTVLYDYVDPDALDSLFADTRSGIERGPGVVTFTVDDAVVTIWSDRVEVEPAG